LGRKVETSWDEGKKMRGGEKQNRGMNSRGERGQDYQRKRTCDRKRRLTGEGEKKTLTEKRMVYNLGKGEAVENSGRTGHNAERKSGLTEQRC